MRPRFFSDSKLLRYCNQLYLLSNKSARRCDVAIGATPSTRYWLSACEAGLKLKFRNMIQEFSCCGNDFL